MQERGDGERGFVYVSASTATLHKDPSANSPIIATAPHGGRLFIQRYEAEGWHRLVLLQLGRQDGMGSAGRSVMQPA